MSFEKQGSSSGERGERVVYGFMPPPFSYPPPEPEDRIPMSEEMLKEMQLAKLRQMHANARMQETAVILRGLEEMRLALQQFSISDGDRGATERPPLESAFEEINKGRLQNAYLRLTERYLNYCEHMLVHQLAIKVTHEIKKSEVEKTLPPESKQ